MSEESRLVTCERCSFPTPSDRANCQGCGAPVPERLRTDVIKLPPKAMGPATRSAGIQGEKIEVRAPTRIVRERRFMGGASESQVSPPTPDPIPLSPAAPPKAAARPRTPDELIGATVDGHYKIVKKLGEGGMGVVFETFDTNLERKVAMKVIQANLRENPMFVERFRREAKIIAQLRHPNLVDCYDFGADESLGALYMILTLLEGISLDQVLAKGAVDPARAVAIASQTLGALEFAHERGIVHRDVKPANIFLEKTPGGETVKVLDFGLAREEMQGIFAGGGNTLTHTGMFIGTPAYMAPEQIAGKGITGLSDVYAMGCVLYEMLVGRPPFTGDSVGDVVAKQLRDAPRPEPLRAQHVSPELERVVLKALAKKPADRHAGARSFRLALEEAPLQAPAGAKPPGRSVVLPPKSGPTKAAAPPAKTKDPALTTGEFMGLMDIATPDAKKPNTAPPDPRADTPGSGSQTRQLRPSELLRLPKASPKAGAPPPKKQDAANEERIVAWVWCDPLPPFPLGVTPVVKIGRSQQCELVLPHPSVSRVHACVMIAGERIVLEDRSQHGTFVNGNRITTQPIVPGDNVVIGPYELKICSKAVPLHQSAASEDDTRGFVRPKIDKIEDAAMSGRLETQPVADLLKGLEQSARSGTLAFESGPLVGELVLVDGLPVRAVLGPIVGEMAIHAMLTLKKGTYSFQPTVKAGDRNVNKKLSVIITEATKALEDDD
jgi:serine/threonine protein kinase